MLHFLRSVFLAPALAVAMVGAAPAAEPLRLATVVELSGSGASAGTQWRDGVELAKDEVNRGGGVLGRLIETRQYDTQTNPGVSRAQMQKALDDEPFAVLGTIYSSSTMVNMLLAQRAGVPQFVGAQAAEVTQAGNPYVFRVNIGQQYGIPKAVSYMRDTLGAKRVAAVYVNDSMGKGGGKVFVEATRKAGLALSAELPTEVGQVDFTATVQAAKNSNADAVFVYLHEEETARFLVAARRLGLQAPLIGDTNIASQKVIDLAGAAANGVRGYVPLTPDAPIERVKAFRAAFEKRYGYTPAHSGMQGYIAVHVVKAVLESLGKVDRKAFADKLHGLTILADKSPGVLMDTRWDEQGEVDRMTYMMEVVNGKQVPLKEIPPDWARDGARDGERDGARK